MRVEGESPHLPEGTVTFLFTDIEGSTKQANQRRFAASAQGAILASLSAAALRPWEASKRLRRSRRTGQSMILLGNKLPRR
jgi:hypothetical protein